MQPLISFLVFLLIVYLVLCQFPLGFHCPFPF